MLSVKNRYFALILACAAALTGCSDSNLDIPEKGVISEDDYFLNDEHCVAASAAMYQSLIHKTLETNNRLWIDEWILNLLSDDVVKGSSGWKWDDFHYLQMYAYTSSQKYVQSVYECCFNPINKANTVIDYFKDGNTPTMRQAVAEAKVLRSFVYLKLIGYWGNPPIVDHVLQSPEEYEQPNATSDDLWSFVIGSIDEALDSKALTSKQSVDDRSCTRITREFALAVKGKAQVMAGRYAEARETLAQVVASGKYALVPSDELASKFLSVDGDFCCENLFESNVVYDESMNFKNVAPYDELFCYCGLNASKYKFADADSWLKPFGSKGWQYFPPTEKVIKAMIAHEGTQSYRFKAWFWSYEDLLAMGVDNFEKYRTVALETGEVPTGYKNNCTQPEGCGYWNRKFTGRGYEEWKGGNSKQDEVNRRWMRYAEVLLLYAEACAQAGDPEGKGLKALNDVQRRAGAPVSQALTLSEVKREKWFEMWDEGCRYVDLVRWGDAATELADHHSQLPVFMGYKKDAEGKTTSEYLVRYIDLDQLTESKHGFKTGRDEHLPYPATEIANNTKLKQNLGWE